MNKAEKANIMYDHYKDTFSIQKENEKSRNKLFILDFKKEISLSFSLILLFKVLTLKVSALLFSVRVLIVLSLSLNCSSTLIKVLDKF